MSLRLALECPTYLLEEVQPLADFDWILTHLVLEDEEYAKFYRDSEKFKVLDNSVNELLEPCSLGQMERAEEILGGVDLVVPPDFLGNYLATLASLDKALRVWPREKILPCVQGEDIRQIKECTDGILSRGFNRIAVPYDITCERTCSLEAMAESRLRVVNSIISRVPKSRCLLLGFSIHLLGMTTLEELTRHNSGWVKSVDTGGPILHGLKGLRFGRDNLLPKAVPTLEQMPGESEESSDSRLADTYYNIACLRKVVGGG